MFFDPLYLLFLLPGAGLALWARSRVSSAYAEGSRVPAASGRTGAEAAAEVLRAAGVDGVRIEPVTGALSDYYDPGAKVLRLSRGVYSGRSLAALGVAAHEAGHAIQDARRVHVLILRNLAVPAAGIGSSVFWLFLVAGVLIPMFQLVLAGIALLSVNVVFQLVNLPVEYDASRRARESLLSAGVIGPAEDTTVGRVLDAAAVTNVAAALTGAPSRLYDLFRFGVGGRRDDGAPAR